MKTNTETDPMVAAYGPFVPGSEARAIRTENAQRGDRTCWHCLGAFKPHGVMGEDGRLHRLGRGRWYCSRDCAKADRRRGEDRSQVAEVADDVLYLDLRGCRGCAA